MKKESNRNFLSILFKIDAIAGFFVEKKTLSSLKLLNLSLFYEERRKHRYSR